MRRLTVVGPGEESGTYDTFVEFAIADFAEERGQDEATRADYTASGNDNVIVEGIEGADSSLGWVGYAYYAAEADRMKAIGIDTGDGCVVPSEETIGDGTYGFSRSLFIYVNTAKAEENPAVAAFVDLYLSEEGLALVPEAGYVSLPRIGLPRPRKRGPVAEVVIRRMLPATRSPGWPADPPCSITQFERVLVATTTRSLTTADFRGDRRRVGAERRMRGRCSSPPPPSRSSSVH